MAHLNGLGCEIWLILRDERSLKKTFREEHVNKKGHYLFPVKTRAAEHSFFLSLMIFTHVSYFLNVRPGL